MTSAEPPEPPAGRGRIGGLARWWRASLLSVVAIMLGIAGVLVLRDLRSVLTMVLIAFFLALALEPSVTWLVARRWRRAWAASAVMVLACVAVGVLVTVFGGLFVDQLVQLVDVLVTEVEELRGRLDPVLVDGVADQRRVVADVLRDYGDDLASGVLGLGGALVSAFVRATGVLLVAYYMLASGPRLRAAVCRPLPPRQQEVVLELWAVAQAKISGFISSRVVLALASATTTTLFLALLDIGYAVPLGMFVGVVSQFVPTVGTYIAGALPILVAATTSWGLALAVLAFIVAYQQVENLVLSPRVSARSLELNPAVAFLSVLAFGAVLGPLGAFLGLPLAATVQAVVSTYLKRYELVESSLLRDTSSHARASDPEPSDPGGHAGDA